MTKTVEEAAIKLAVEAVRIAEKDNVCLLCVIQRLFIRTEKIVEMGNLEHGMTRPSFDTDEIPASGLLVILDEEL